jgi:hypothetical protein
MRLHELCHTKLDELAKLLLYSPTVARTLSLLLATLDRLGLGKAIE